MSLRPAVRREGPLDQALLMLVVILLGATFMLWLTGQVAGFVNSGTWPSVSLSEMGAIVTRVPRHPLDPAAAWPADDRQLLPGPVLFWATFVVLLAVLATAWVFLSSLLRSARRRMGRAVVVERATPSGDQVGPTGWARPQLFRELYVKGPTPWRVTLGRVNGRLVAAEPLQAVIALGPTQSQKSSGLTIPAVLEWDGPVLAACVKPDLIRSTIGRRWQKGEVFLYDPAGATGMEANTWSPLPRCETWEGAYRMALSLVNASRMGSRAEREMEAIPGASHQPAGGHAAGRGHLRPHHERRPPLGPAPGPGRDHRRHQRGQRAGRPRRLRVDLEPGRAAPQPDLLPGAGGDRRLHRPDGEGGLGRDPVHRREAARRGGQHRLCEPARARAAAARPPERGPRPGRHRAGLRALPQPGRARSTRPCWSSSTTPPARPPCPSWTSTRPAPAATGSSWSPPSGTCRRCGPATTTGPRRCSPTTWPR